MNLLEELKKAMKAKDAERLSVLRMLQAAVKNQEIELGKKETGLSQEEFAQVLKKEIKKRTKAIEQFKIGNRQDLADQYEREIKILEGLSS
ncbi:MAG: GatB/YqeY domain-containing protein [Patescibacteria group bacterium]